jgi:triphosphoribosyl-dephospho-CoA synthase
MTACLPAPATLARLAADALREELATYPKPGLVSLVDSGSHPGLNASHFLASITTLEPFFAELAEAGAREAGFGELQTIGRAAEAAMTEATGGENTHRGAIFCLGLLVAAAGTGSPAADLGRVVQARWAPAIPPARDLPAVSHGLAVCRALGLEGVRGEVRRGFPSVYQTGLPTLQDTLPAGREAARVQAFFALLAVCEDTTLIHRGGAKGWAFGRDAAREFLVAGGMTAPDGPARAEAIHREFVHRHLTAGGAADLLAATLFVHDLTHRA